MGTVISTSEDYTYTVSAGKATVTGYIGAGGAITIPSTLGGAATATIGMNAFRSCTNVTSVIIPDGLTAIGNYAFYGCTVLTSVTVPSSVAPFIRVTTAPGSTLPPMVGLLVMRSVAETPVSCGIESVTTGATVS